MEMQSTEAVAHRIAPVEQNLPLAIIAGAAAALAGAGVWAAITVATGYQIGWMAVGVGVLVGYAVRFAGKGAALPYSLTGAAFALIGCAVGNLLTVSYFVAQNEGVSYGAVPASLDVEFVTQMMSATFAPMDLLFYALAVYCGFKYALRDNGGSEVQSA